MGALCRYLREAVPLNHPSCAAPVCTAGFLNFTHRYDTLMNIISPVCARKFGFTGNGQVKMLSLHCLKAQVSAISIYCVFVTVSMSELRAPSALGPSNLDIRKDYCEVLPRLAPALGRAGCDAGLGPEHSTCTHKVLSLNLSPIYQNVCCVLWPLVRRGGPQ